MKCWFTLAVFSILLSACKPPRKLHENYSSETIKIVQVAENTYQHTSYLQTQNFGKVTCNGMVYLNEDEAVVFDTPIDSLAAKELIDWIGKKQIKAVVVTHFHIDCLGSLGYFHSKGVPSYATHQTIQLAKAHDEQVIPQHGFEERMEFQLGEAVVYAQYFGEGHTKDNIVGYVPSEEVLFGGCLIKAMNAPKGNLNDANVKAWPNTVRALKATFPEAKVVIPGHGKNGGTALLDYTIELFTPKPKPIVFFLHNRFLEEHDLTDAHPQFGRVEYQEILRAFEREGLQVISKQRDGNVNARDYAQGIVQKVDSLIASGVAPSNITVIGTSKGGYIAQYVATLANNPALNFVFIGCFQESDLQNIPEINYCGNILNIYEASDPFGVSAVARKQQSTCTIEHFQELELHTGMGHGFLFKALPEWISPAIQWAKGNYDLE